MLVLSRKLYESIVIDDNIIVTVVRIKGDEVRLGVTAPLAMPVNREEVQDIIEGQTTEPPTE